MRNLAAAAAVVVLTAAGCGGSQRTSSPEYAYLTNVRVDGSSVRFEFESAPREVTARYEQRRQIAECGSGRLIRLRGRAFAVVHFRPAASARLEGEDVVPTYRGSRRLRGGGPVLEAVKSCDFEADLGWAVGLERRIPLAVVRDGRTVTVTFG